MDRALHLRDERATLLRSSQELVEEYAWLPAGHVIACLVRCRDELERHGVREGLAMASLAIARARLQESSPAARLVG